MISLPGSISSPRRRAMDDHKIAFIICTNDRLLLDECLMYLGMLRIPEGFSTDVITITDAPGMCAGYNTAMRDSDARYKIYMHQDVFITDRDFLSKLLLIFDSDSRIGMVGMVGAVRLDTTGIMWEMPRVGNLRTDKIDHLDFGFHEDQIIDCDCVDGLLIATCHDIPWREDIFTGFHFYDISESMEFKKRGLRVVVKDVADDGIVHDDGVVNMFSYEPWREAFVEEYRDMLSPVGYRASHGLPSDLTHFKSLYEKRDLYFGIYDSLSSFMDKAIAARDIDRCLMFIRMVEAELVVCNQSDRIVTLYFIAQIAYLERLTGEEKGFISDVSSADAAIYKYRTARLMFIRLRLGAPPLYHKEAEEFLTREISSTARKRISDLVDRRLGIE